MSDAIALTGTVAAPGMALGPLVFLTESREPTRLDRASLHDALKLARAELTRLIEAQDDPDAIAILEFQLAMLEDDSVVTPALERLAAGASATSAWHEAMELQLVEYVEADDPVFRARATDLRDLRDRVMRQLEGTHALTIPPGSVVVARDLTPSLFLETDWQGGGIALFEGSSRSHLAMLARARGIPLLVGINRAHTPLEPQSHATALIDGERGELVLSPSATQQEHAVSGAKAREASSVPAAPNALGLEPLTAPDQSAVKLFVNIADRSELSRLDADQCDGIGLVRTELLLRTLSELHDEDHQFQAYKSIVEWADGKPVTIRTLDAGADKPIEGYTVTEGNPFLGVRGVRLSLAEPEIFETQLRALARAALYGPLRIMIPMVTNPDEMLLVKEHLEHALTTLDARGTAHARPALGMMVEVPAAALSLAQFEADFFSIGSNDLIQYLTAASRESERLAPLQDPLQPTVLNVIRAIVSHATQRGIDVSLCGDMAGDPRCAGALLDLGLRSFSVSPVALSAVADAIRAHANAPLLRETR